jgi:hypothetical protein
MAVVRMTMWREAVFRLLSCVAAVLVCCPAHGVAQSLYDGTSVNVGARYVRNVFDPKLPRDLVNHENHRDDALFLFGSPGTTVLGEIHVNTVQLQFGVAHPLGYSNVAFLANYIAEVPVSFDGRVEQQQANDTRPPASGSFIYTMLDDVSTAHLASTGLGFAARLSEGENIWLETQALLVFGKWDMTFEKGWSRFGRDETAIRSKASGFEFSPKVVIGIRNARVGADAALAYRQLRFRHDAESLEDHTARGLSMSFGGRVSF